MSKLIINLALFVFLIFFQTNSFGKENFYEKALNLFKKEKYNEARFLFERNIVYNPKDANSYLYLAKIYNHEENQRKEEFNLETTLLIDPKNEEALLMLMKIALKKSNYNRVNELSETFAKVCINMCDENKEIQESLKNIEPDNEEAILMMMKIAIEKSNYDKVKNLSDTFSKVCKNLCDENHEIKESLKNIDPKNES